MAPPPPPKPPPLRPPSPSQNDARPKLPSQHEVRAKVPSLPDARPKIPSFAEAPPPPPKPPGGGLDEVERALSVLDGRHPEHERIRRETEERNAEKRRAIDAESKKYVVESRVRMIKIGAGILAGIAIALVGARLFMRSRAFDSTLDAMTAPFTNAGLTVVASSSRGPSVHAEASVDAGCVFAIAPPGVVMKVKHGPESFEAVETSVYCACVPEAVSVDADIGSREGGVRLLYGDFARVGGALALPLFEPHVRSIQSSGAECNDVALDAWIGAKRAPELSPLKDDTRARLLNLGALGFTPTGKIEGAASFSVVPVPAASCVLAMPDESTRSVTLRLQGGTRPATAKSRPLAWCTKDAATYVIEREGSGEVDIFTAPARTAGGLLGAREAIASLFEPVVWVDKADAGWDAASALIASGIPEADISISSAPNLTVPPDTRVVAFSVAEIGSFVFARPDKFTVESPEAAYSTCVPDETKFTQAICVHSARPSWRALADANTGGIAAAKLPFWMQGVRDVSDGNAITLEANLIKLARLLHQRNFIPSLIEGVTETKDGADVLGLQGDDHVVAIVVGPVAPFVFPLTDGDAWSITDEPKAVPISPGQHVHLTTKPIPTGALNARRTVVFRHSKK